MEEGAAPAILTGDAHLIAFIQQAGVGQIFSKAPVQRQCARRHFAPVIHDLGDAGVHFQTFRHPQQPFGQIAHHRQRHRRRYRRIPVLVLVGRPVNRIRAFDMGHGWTRHLPTSIEIITVFGLHLLEILAADHAFAAQLFGVQRRRCFPRPDFFVHHRLGGGGFVGLVMAQPPVAHHVNDHILVEGHPVFNRQLGDEQHRFRVIAVHMKNRGLHHLGDIGAIQS